MSGQGAQANGATAHAVTTRRSRLALAFGIVDLVAALVTALGVFGGLPSRWWPVDLTAALVIVLLAAAGWGLLSGARWGARVARIASLVTLVSGLVLIALLAFTASYLSGIYGAVGRGGALILVLVAALALPYLVAFPASQLMWLGPLSRRHAGTLPGAAKPEAS